MTASPSHQAKCEWPGIEVKLYRDKTCDSASQRNDVLSRANQVINVSLIRQTDINPSSQLCDSLSLNCPPPPAVRTWLCLTYDPAVSLAYVFTFMLTTRLPILSASRHLFQRHAARSTLFQPLQPRFSISTSASRMAQEYKLKGITSIDLKNGDKQEAEVEGVENGKVLLVKVNDKVHATSSNCTHYGAPLVKGVVSGGGEGRLTCPWHGGMTSPLHH